MKFNIEFFLLLLTVAHAIGTPIVDNGVYDYHLKYGIPRALKIQKEESEILSGERVAGGSGTTVLSVPYQAGLIMTVLIWSSVCGGTIISENKILTAAHCYNDGNNLATSVTVVVGSSLLFTGGTRITDTTVITYYGYNPWIVANDIAVVRVPTITFSTVIQAVNLPTSASEVNNNYVGNNAVASGFGVTNDDETIGLLQGLSSVNLRVISNEECARSYPTVVQDHHLCTSGAGGVGLCGGDSGGPLVTVVGWRRVLIGVGSFLSIEGCLSGNPSGFSRVTSFLYWINNV